MTLPNLPIISTTFLFVFLNELLVRLAGGHAIVKMIGIGFLFSSGILLSYYAVKNFYKFKYIHPYFKILFLLLSIWSTFTITRSINTNPKDLVTLFTHYRVGGWDWVAPLAVFFGLSITNWIKLFPLLINFLIIGILFAITGSIIHVNIAAFTLLSVYPILFLTLSLHSKHVKLLVIVSMVAYIIYAFIVLSNRSSLIIFSLFSLFFILEYLRSKSISHFKKVFLSLTLSIMTIFLLINISSYYKTLQSDREMSTDTRTFLFIELFSDMSDNEKWIGRGALGQYYSPYFYAVKQAGIEGGDAAERSTNEIGYLHMILKGGYVMMVLYLLILVPAAYLGIFKSKNIVSRMSGYIVLSFIIMFVLIYPPEYKIDFLILWMAVGTAISPSLRKLKNEDFMIKKKKRLILENK